MEKATSIRHQSASPAPGNSASKLVRYPLRSATKSKADNTPTPLPLSSSASMRGRPQSSVTKSMSVLDLSGKAKPAKPARRLSIPAKATPSPAPKPMGNITPISETRAKRSVNDLSRSDTPGSDISRSSNRSKFNIISSASYWLSQIKLSESAAKHSISLGLFKLAVQAGCEPLHRMREELKSYVRKHDLAELGELVKELFESYNVVESYEKMQVSETLSHAPGEGTQSSDDDLHSSSTMGTQKLEPKSLNTSDASPAKGSLCEISKKNNPKIRISASKNSANSKSVSEAVGNKTQKKYQKPSKQDPNVENLKVKKLGKKSPQEECPTIASAIEEPTQQDKENKDNSQMEEISLIEVNDS